MTSWSYRADLMDRMETERDSTKVHPQMDGNQIAVLIAAGVTVLPNLPGQLLGNQNLNLNWHIKTVLRCLFEVHCHEVDDLWGRTHKNQTWQVTIKLNLDSINNRSDWASQAEASGGKNQKQGADEPEVPRTVEQIESCMRDEDQQKYWWPYQVFLVCFRLLSKITSRSKSVDNSSTHQPSILLSRFILNPLRLMLN